MADPKKPVGDDSDENDHGEALARTFQEIEGELDTGRTPSGSEDTGGMQEEHPDEVVDTK